ncbi:DinB family protein [Aquihabitans sp. McL0605]|uniref:DinB family protein n=1 Tax=Aquihabitans sp. McL0605 TaxID=3415671 RepID=UPI003CFA8219
MEDHRGERFTEADFTGARFHGVDLSNVTISDAWLVDVDISGALHGLTVNGIDVTGYVEDELDRRHPERLLLRPEHVAGMHVAWAKVEDIAAATAERARSLPPELLDVSVGGEWSYLDTLRHLLYATDRWITGPVQGEPDAFHRLGRPNEELDEVVPGRFDVDAQPTLDEVLAARRDRMDRVAAVIGGLDEAALGREVASPNGGTTTLRYCLQVIFREEWWHDQYANRDLSILAEDETA